MVSFSSISVGRRRCNPGVYTSRTQAFLGERRIVVTVDQVVGDPGVPGLVLENRFEYFATLALMAKGFISFGSTNCES